jgi:hypothetical protein
MARETDRGPVNTNMGLSGQKDWRSLGKSADRNNAGFFAA